MNNTFVSVKGVLLRGRRGLNTVSENQKIAILQQLFLLTFICLDHQEKQQQTEMHVTFKEKWIKMCLPF